MDLKQAIPLCIVACEAEAVAHGFPPECGKDMYDGIIADDTCDWDDAAFINWVQYMNERYAVGGKTEEELIVLYNEINVIIGRYGEMLTR